MEHDRDRASLREHRASSRSQCCTPERRFCRRWIHSNAPMPLVVDSFVMGPFQSNCYVVRAERGAPRRGVIDPGDDPTELRLELARMGARAGGILVTHTDVDHIGGVARSPTAPAREVWAPRGRGRGAAHRRDARRLPRRRHEPAHTVTGGDEITVAGIDFEVVDVPGHSAGHVAFHADGAALLRATCSSRARSAASTSRAATGRRCSTRCARSLDRFPPETIVRPGPRPADDARPRARRRTRSCASCAPNGHRERDGVPGTAGDARRPAGRRRVVALVRDDGGGDRALRLAAHPDARLRGHGALRRARRERLGRRAQGDVHLHRPQRPVADAAPGGHGADLPRVRRARHASRAAAGEGVHDRADVPLRRARVAAATASTTSCPSRRSARPTRRSTPRSSSSTSSFSAGSA